LFLQQTRFLSFWDFEVNLFIRQYSDSGGEVSVSTGKNRDRLLKIPVKQQGRQHHGNVHGNRKKRWSRDMAE